MLALGLKEGAVVVSDLKQSEGEKVLVVWGQYLSCCMCNSLKVFGVGNEGYKEAAEVY